MIGKILKTIVTLILGMIIGIAGFFGALGVGGYWTVTSLSVGQIVSPFLGDQTDEYLSDDAQEMKLLEAIQYITELKTFGEVEKFLPIVSKTLTDVLEDETISKLVSIDRDKLGDVTLDSLTSMQVDELMNSLTITATIESVLEITKLNLDDLGFGFITDLSIYNDVDYEKVKDDNDTVLKGDVAFERAGNGVLEDLYVKSGNTYVPYTPKGNKLDPANTYYVIKDGLNINNYLYATSPERKVYSVDKDGVITYDTSANNREISYKYMGIKNTPVLELVPVLMHKIFEITFDDLELVCTDFLKLDAGSNIDVDMLFDALKSATPSIADQNLGYILNNLGVFAEDLQVAKLLQAIGIYDPSSDDMISSLIGAVAFKGGNAQTLGDIMDGIFDVYAVDLVNALGIEFPDLIQNVIDMVCYKDGNKNSTPLTINEIIDNVQNITTAFKTADIIDALDMPLFDRFEGIINLIAYTDGNKLNIDETLDKVLYITSGNSTLTIMDLFNALSPESGDGFVDLNRFRPIVELIAIKNGTNLNVDQLLDRFNTIADPDQCDLYTADIVDAVIDAGLLGSLIEQFEEIINLVAYADPDNKTGKYTVGETFDIILNITSTIKTLDLVDALIEAGIMSDLLDKFYGIIEIVALDENDNRLTVDSTLDKVGALTGNTSNVTIMELFNAVSPETVQGQDFNGILDLNRFRPIIEVFAYTDPANKTGAVTIDGLISRFNTITDPDQCDIYTADIVDAIIDAGLLGSLIEQFEEIINLVAYADPDNKTGKYTVGETFDIILNITSTIKTLDLVDALIEAGIMSDLLDKFYGIIEVFALADNGDRLTIDDTLDKALNLMAEDSSVTVIDLFNSISPETGDTVMDVNKFRPIVEVFAYTDPANKTGAVNLYDLISRFSAILTPDCDIYTIDIINALKDAEIFDLSEMQELLDLICYDANDSTKALTVYGTYNQVMNFDDLYTIDVVEALASNVKLLDEFSNIINVFAYDGTTKLTLAGTLEIFGTITTDQCTIIAKDLVDAVSTDLMDLSRFNNIINLLVLDDAGNKLTISGVFDRIRNITTDTNGVSAKKAIDAANDIIDLSRFNNIINVFVLDNNNNELTIGQVMTRFNTLMIDGESDVYADELVNAVSTDIMDLSAFENIINLLVKYDDGSSVTVGGVLTRINNLMTDYSDISAKKAIDAVGDIISLEAFDSVINYLVLDAGGNELTIGQVMDRVFGIMNEDSDITVKGLLNAVKGIGFDLSAFDPVVDLVAKENGTNLNANATLNRVFNFTDIVVYDIVDALTEMGFDFAGMFSGMGIDINDIYDVLLIDAKDGTTRLKVGELLANVFEIKVGNLASSVGFDLELFGLQSCQELCLNDVLIRNSNDEIIQIDLTKLWDVLDIPLVFETLLQLRPSYLMEKILAKRLTVEYFAEKGLANAEGTELAISIYDREGNRISYTISKQTDTTYFNNNGTISEITTQKHFILDANGNYIYEAYDGSDNRYCDGVRGDDLLNRINFMTISELIDGYATDAQYDMLRKFLPGTTTLAELFMGEGFSTDDTDVTLADFLGENTVNANHILKAIAYNPADGSKIKVSEIDDRLNSLTVSEVILVTDEFGNVTGNYGDGATKILAQVLPAGTLITDIGNVDFAGNIKGLTIKEAMGIGEGQSSGDKYIDMLIEKGATVGNFAETLANLSLLEFAGVELFTEVTVTSSYTSDMALYTFDGNNTYTLVDGSFNVLNGEYTYSSLDTLTKYYVINSDANFWHLMLTTHSDNTPNSEKTSASFGAYDTIVVNNNATVGNFENNEVEIHTDALKIKYMIDIGIATTGTITTSGSVVYGVFDSTIGDAIQALIEKILLAG